MLNRSMGPATCGLVLPIDLVCKCNLCNPTSGILKKFPGKKKRIKKETFIKKSKIAEQKCLRNRRPFQDMEEEVEEEVEVEVEAPHLTCLARSKGQECIVNSGNIRDSLMLNDNLRDKLLEEMPCINSREPSILTLVLRQGTITKTFTYNLVLSPLEYITPEHFCIRTPTIFPLSSSLEPWLSIGTLEQLSKHRMRTTCRASQNLPACSIK